MKLAKPLSKFVAVTTVLLLTTFAAYGGKDPGLIMEKEKYFKKLKDPTIGQFNVSFAYSDIKQAGSYKDKWRKLDGKSESAMRVNLKGLSDEIMQKITDEAYKDFKTKLEAAGIKTSEVNLYEGVSKFSKKTMEKVTLEGYPERQSHYEAYGAVESKTVPRSGTKVISFQHPHVVGFSGNDLKKEVISVRYLLHFGYLDTTASKSENKFMNEVTLKTGVTFHPGIQVYWRSGADVYMQSHKKKGSILIKDHIGAPGDFGEIKLVEESNWGKSYKELDITVDEQKYYQLALSALTQANTKIVNQIADL